MTSTRERETRSSSSGRHSDGARSRVGNGVALHPLTDAGIGMEGCCQTDGHRASRRPSRRISRIVSRPERRFLAAKRERRPASSSSGERDGFSGSPYDCRLHSRRPPASEPWIPSFAPSARARASEWPRSFASRAMIRARSCFPVMRTRRSPPRRRVRRSARAGRRVVPVQRRRQVAGVGGRVVDRRAGVAQGGDERVPEGVRDRPARARSPRRPCVSRRRSSGAVDRPAVGVAEDEPARAARLSPPADRARRAPASAAASPGPTAPSSAAGRSSRRARPAGSACSGGRRGRRPPSATRAAPPSAAPSGSRAARALAARRRARVAAIASAIAVRLVRR